MKYIIMCGGNYVNFETPRHLLVVNKERLVDRTIRLLRKNKINDIYISTNNPAFNDCDATIINSVNNYVTNNVNRKGYWVEAFHQCNEPACYLFGDVYYSEECIEKIVKAKTDDILFFSTCKPFAYNYIKDHVEPLAFKVVDYEKFYKAIDFCKKAVDTGKCWRHPIAFDVWSVLKGISIEKDLFKKQTADVFGSNYVPIYDYSCDIDNIKDVQILEEALNHKCNSICFGIPSYIADNNIRDQRVEEVRDCLIKLVNQFNLPIIVIAQNWDNAEIIKDNDLLSKNLIIYNYPKLGITNARIELREKFLESNFEHMIMLDDDIIFGCPSAYRLLRTIESKKDGWYNFGDPHLFFLIISKKIYSKYEFPDIEVTRDHIFEDVVFSRMLSYYEPDTNYRLNKWLVTIDSNANRTQNRINESSWYDGNNSFMNECSINTKKYIEQHLTKRNSYDDLLYNLSYTETSTNKKEQKIEKISYLDLFW